jgi:hypothetical protein
VRQRAFATWPCVAIWSLLIGSQEAVGGAGVIPTNLLVPMPTIANGG